MLEPERQSLLATNNNNKAISPKWANPLNGFKQKEQDLETGLKPYSTKFAGISRGINHLQSKIQTKAINLESAEDDISWLKLDLEKASAQADHDLKLAHETLDKLKRKHRLFFVLLLVILGVCNILQGLWYFLRGSE